MLDEEAVTCAVEVKVATVEDRVVELLALVIAEYKISSTSAAS